MSSSASGASPALPAVSQEREQSFVTTSINLSALKFYKNGWIWAPNIFSPKYLGMFCWLCACCNVGGTLVEPSSGPLLPSYLLMVNHWHHLLHHKIESWITTSIYITVQCPSNYCIQEMIHKTCLPRIVC